MVRASRRPGPKPVYPAVIAIFGGVLKVAVVRFDDLRVAPEGPSLPPKLACLGSARVCRRGDASSNESFAGLGVRVGKHPFDGKNHNLTGVTRGIKRVGSAILALPTRSLQNLPKKHHCSRSTIVVSLDVRLRKKRKSNI